MSELVPAPFEITTGAVLDCKRPGCDWWQHIGGESLTEVVALAREHVEEAHR